MKSMIKAVRLGAILSVATLSLTGMARAADLTAGANIGNVPWEFEDATGKMVGFEIDLVTEVAKRLGKSVEFVNIPFNGLFPAVQSGRINMAVSSITITKKRLETLTFAQPYYDSDQSLTVTAKSGLGGLKDMGKKVIGVDTASTGDQWATQNQAKYGFAEIKRYEGLAPAMLDLAAGRIDGYVSDIPALQYYSKDKPQFKVVERIPTDEKYSIMFKKDDPLATQVDAQIAKLKQEGVIAQLHEKWFGAKAEASSTTVAVVPMPKL